MTGAAAAPGQGGNFSFRRVLPFDLAMENRPFRQVAPCRQGG